MACGRGRAKALLGEEEWQREQRQKEEAAREEESVQRGEWGGERAEWEREKEAWEREKREWEQAKEEWEREKEGRERKPGGLAQEEEWAREKERRRRAQEEKEGELERGQAGERAYEPTLPLCDARYSHSVWCSRVGARKGGDAGRGVWEGGSGTDRAGKTEERGRAGAGGVGGEEAGA